MRLAGNSFSMNGSIAGMWEAHSKKTFDVVAPQRPCQPRHLIHLRDLVFPIGWLIARNAPNLLIINNATAAPENHEKGSGVRIISGAPNTTASTRKPFSFLVIDSSVLIAHSHVFYCRNIRAIFSQPPAMAVGVKAANPITKPLAGFFAMP